MTSFQATLVNTGFGQLILRDSLGKVAQKWTLSNPKCVIGSGTNCNVSCQLPGIVDHHVLMVIGAKQVFIRAMASGLTRNGQNISELVLPGTETEFNFESPAIISSSRAMAYPPRWPKSLFKKHPLRQPRFPQLKCPHAVLPTQPKSIPSHPLHPSPKLNRPLLRSRPAA